MVVYRFFPSPGSRISRWCGVGLVSLLLSLLWACSPTPSNERPATERADRQDAGGGSKDQGIPPDTPRCRPNNDGIIERSEVAFLVGASVNVRRNPVGRTLRVNHVGETNAKGVREWDFRGLGTISKSTVQTLDPKGRWFLSDFPNANILVPYTLASYKGETFQVLRDAGNDLFLEGVVSAKAKPDNDKILLRYDRPVPLLSFPLRDGKEWVITAKSSGTVQGVPVTSADQYRIKVAGRGTLLLPDIEFENTLRLEVHVVQRLLGGQIRQLYQLLFMHECYGEVARVESKPNEKNPTFTQAALVRHISF